MGTRLALIKALHFLKEGVVVSITLSTKNKTTVYKWIA
jgi:hypothetical protein